MSYLIENSSDSEEQFIAMALGEQEEIVMEQIQNRINKHSINYFKVYINDIETEFEDRPRKLKDHRLNFARNVLAAVCQAYPDVFELHGVTDDNVMEVADIVYRFFVKDSYMNVEMFMVQHILNANNRKNYTEYFKDTRSTAYTREAYGSKQNYIIINNVNNIIELLATTELEFDEALKQISKTLDYPGYIDKLAVLIRDDIIAVSNTAMTSVLLKHVIDSEYEGNLNIKISTVINKQIIYPMIGDLTIFAEGSDGSNIGPNIKDGLIMLRRINN